jgi:hypothetical protein
MKSYRLTLIALCFVVRAYSQEVASVNLRRNAVSSPPKSQNQQRHSSERDEKPAGCEKPEIIIGDGLIVPEDHQLRKIKVEFVSLSESNLVIGEEIEATVKLQNVGKQSIEIPWSTDYRTAHDNQDPDDRAWEFGRIELQSADDGPRENTEGRLDSNIDFRNLSQTLFASPFVPDCKLTVKPGEWITAQINFLAQVANPAMKS